MLTLQELHLPTEVREKIDRFIEEYTYRDTLGLYDIPVDNKVLLYGHTGCGKTATTQAIGLALRKKVITLPLVSFVSSKLGQTSQNLSEYFRQASRQKAILFIDEFDFLGKLRDYHQKDSGEMKRLVNTLIQQMDEMSQDVLLIGATNHVKVIDSALLRRFQIKLKYDLPSEAQLDTYYDDILQRFPDDMRNVTRQYGISFAEAKDQAYQQVKARIIAQAKRDALLKQSDKTVNSGEQSPSD